MTSSLFLDLDGVLADFNRGYERLTGRRAHDPIDWRRIRATPGFYQTLDPLPDMEELWAAVAPLAPIILTGVPMSVPEAPANKRAWVATHLGPTVPVICCRARDKAQYALPDDVLVDDRDQYRTAWIARGGWWITHRNAVSTLAQLRAIGLLETR